MRIDTSKFVIGKIYEFTSPLHPDWVGFTVRAEPNDSMKIIAARQKNRIAPYSIIGEVISRSGFANGDYWTECVFQRGTFGKWFKEHGL